MESFPMVYFGVGGISFEEIQNFIDRYNIKPAENVSFIYGFQAEPTPIEKNNILKLKTLMNSFAGFNFGFEDHTVGSDKYSLILPLLSLPLGVYCIEKHLTLDRILGLEDSISALTPIEFSELVANIRMAESALGKGTSDLSTAEKGYRKKVLKVVVSKTDMSKGQEIKKESLLLRRVENVNEPAIYRKEDIIGRKLKVNLVKYDQITKEMVS